VDEQDIFVLADEQQANGAVQQVLSAGGQLVEFTPIRESLEDFFLRQQGAPTSAATEEVG
jgi:hypothetical protein